MKQILFYNAKSENNISHFTTQGTELEKTQEMLMKFCHLKAAYKKHREAFLRKFSVWTEAFTG